MLHKIRAYTIPEEIWHSIIHGIGIIFGISVLVLLVTLSAVYGNVWNIVSSAIFGTSVILMYTASTLYHAIPNQKVKKILKKCDHIAIYYLIAGTYTPFLLVNLRGDMGWTLFGIVWGLAILGTILKIVKGGSGTKLWSLLLYLGMGWLILFAGEEIFRVLPKISIIFLLLGAFFYTIGIFFYVWKSRRWTHVIWHVLVLTGTMMHFFAILFGCVLI